MNPAAIYRQNAVTTQTRSQIVVLLYEGAVRFMKQAHTEIHKQNYAAKSICLGRAQEIIFELNASLNMDVGADIAKNLRSLYTFVWTRLNEVNIKNDTVLLERLIRIFEDLAGAWRQISA
ncbi:MAG: flagellar export chaperone FliS [Sedimentisphaerales bacterium]|nr:flagellar export chaperone FliS [Sedimentisphaerales bacterium]